MTDNNEDKDYEINVVLMDSPMLIAVMVLFAWLVAAGLYKTAEMVFWVMK